MGDNIFGSLGVAFGSGSLGQAVGVHPQMQAQYYNNSFITATSDSTGTYTIIGPEFGLAQKAPKVESVKCGEHQQWLDGRINEMRVQL